MEKNPGTGRRSVSVSSHRVNISADSLKPEMISPDNHVVYSAFTEYLFSSWKNISCWIDIETYKCLPEELLEERAHELWEKYFVSGSDLYVGSLEDHKSLQAKVAGGSVDAFDSVQHKLLQGFSREMLSSFINSDYGRQLTGEKALDLKKSPLGSYLKHKQDEAEEFSKKHHKKNKKRFRSQSAKDPSNGINDKRTSKTPSLGKFKAVKALASRNIADTTRVRPEWTEAKVPRLEDAVEDVECVFWFREYLRSTAASELLEFWLESSIFVTLPEKSRRKRAMQIFTKFFTPNTDTEICIEGLGRSDIQEMESLCKLEVPPRNIFAFAHDETWQVLSSQCFPGFLASQFWNSYLQQLEGTTNNLPNRRESFQQLEELLGHGPALTFEIAEAESIEDIFYNSELAQSFFDFLSTLNKTRVAEFVFEAAIFRLANEPVSASKCTALLQEYFLNTNKPLEYAGEDLTEVATEAEKNPTKFSLITLENSCWKQLKFDCYLKFLKSSYYEKVLKVQGQVRPRANSQTNLWALWTTLIKLRDNRLPADVIKKHEGAVAKKLQKPTGIDLKEACSNTEIMMAFREYLTSIYCNENLSFWVDAEMFLQTKTGTGKIKEKAKYIWDKYFNPQSDFKIALDDFIDVNGIQQQLQNPTPTMFKDAQNNIWSLLETYCWPNFLTSPMYEKVAKKEPATARPYARSVTIDNLMRLQTVVNEKDSEEEP